MVRIRSGTGGVSRFAAMVAVFVVLPAMAEAQKSGKNFLFRKPVAEITLRGGYALVNTTGEPYTLMRSETTIGERSFDAITLGADLGIFLNRRVDAVLSFDFSGRSTTGEYREWEEDGRPIAHQNTLTRTGVTAGLRYNFTDHGRAISTLAWVPSHTVPYVGVGAGIVWYDFIQEGDFVDDTGGASATIFTDKFQSSHQAFLGTAYAGVDRRLSAHWSLVGEARYQHAAARLVSDFAGLGDIQLSGLALTLGASVRF